MHLLPIIACLIFSKGSICQNSFEVLLRSNYFDSIPSCNGSYFIETTPLFDSVYFYHGHQFVERSSGALSLLEYTDSCTVFFKLESQELNDNKILIRLGKYQHIKSSENSSRSVLIYWVDFTLKRKGVGWKMVKNHRKT